MGMCTRDGGVEKREGGREKGVGGYVHPEIRQRGDHGAVQSVRAPFPLFRQRAALRARDADGEEELDCAEPCRQNNHIMLPHLPVLQLDARLRNPPDPPRLQRRLLMPDRGVVLIADDHPLAPRIVPRRELLPQLRRIGDLPAHHIRAESAQHVRECGLSVRDRVVEGLAEVHHDRALAPAQRGEVAVEEALPIWHGAVFARDDPVGGALVDGQGFGDGENGGDDLGCCGACSPSVSVSISVG